MRGLLLLFLLSLTPFDAAARPASHDVEDLGAVAGAVLACGAYKPLYQFEEILSRYFANTSANDVEEETLMRRYASSKASTFKLMRRRGDNCGSTVSEFSRSKFFSFELYSDGSLRDPNGKFFYPRGQNGLAKDARKIYPAPRGR